MKSRHLVSLDALFLMLEVLLRQHCFVTISSMKLSDDSSDFAVLDYSLDWFLSLLDITILE